MGWARRQLAGVAIVAAFCVVLPPVTLSGSDYATVNGIGFIAGPIGFILILGGVAMLVGRGGPSTS